MNYLYAAALLLFTTIFATAWAEEPIGSLEGHRQIWARYSEAVSVAHGLRNARIDRKTAYEQERQPIMQEQTKIQSQIVTKLKDLETNVSLAKGEFEKTADFERRKQTLVQERRQAIRQEIDALQERDGELEARLKHIVPPPDLNDDSQIEADTVPQLSNIFRIAVRMGAYDADKESVESFNPAYFVPFKNDSGPPRVFKLSGNLVGSINLSPSLAEQARKLSNEDKLFAVFHAEALPFRFSDHFSIPRSKEQIAKDKESAENHRGFWTAAASLGAGLLAARLGNDDPGIVADATRESMESRERSEVKTEDTYNGLVIETGWKDARSPEKLIFWNPQNKDWEILWESR